MALTTNGISYATACEKYNLDVDADDVYDFVIELVIELDDDILAEALEEDYDHIFNQNGNEVTFLIGHKDGHKTVLKRLLEEA